jgi:hypothetical protein
MEEDHVAQTDIRSAVRLFADAPAGACAGVNGTNVGYLRPVDASRYGHHPRDPDSADPQQKAGCVGILENQESGNSGMVTLLSVFSRQGHRCERIEYRMSPPQGTPSDRFTLTSCQQADGSLKLAS